MAGTGYFREGEYIFFKKCLRYYWNSHDTKTMVNTHCSIKNTWKNLPIPSVGRQFLPSKNLFRIFIPGYNKPILLIKTGGIIFGTMIAHNLCNTNRKRNL